MKYEYLLHTWGGFYNPQYHIKHKQIEGYHYFNTKIERDKYLSKLRKIEKKLKANHLMAIESEGYNTRTVTTLHRVITFEGKEYYSKYELSPNYPFEVAKYHLEHKWYPGFNDYPLGDNFDYNNADIQIIQEWITGAFDIND